MRKIRNRIQKGRCEKKKISKCEEICKTYDKVQAACLEYLSGREDIAEIQCNVFLDGLEEDVEYTTDFVCKKTNGDLLVRECVYRKNSKKHTEILKQELFNYVAYAINLQSAGLVVRIKKKPKDWLLGIKIEGGIWKPLPVYEFMEKYEEGLDLSVRYSEVTRKV